MLDQNDSIMALSNASPTEPNEGISPASLTRSVEDPEVNFSAVISMDDAAGLRLALLDRHVESVDDKRGVLDRVDRPADDAPAARVEHAAAGIQGVGCSVMSETQSSSVSERVNWRSTRSSEVGRPLTRFVVAGPGSPAMPALCMRIATRLALTWMPRPLVSSAWT